VTKQDLLDIGAVFRDTIRQYKKRKRSLACGRCSGVDHGDHKTHAFNAVPACVLERAFQTNLARFLEDKDAEASTRLAFENHVGHASSDDSRCGLKGGSLPCRGAVLP